MAYVIETTEKKEIVWDDNPKLAVTRAVVEGPNILELVVQNENSFSIVLSTDVDLLTHLRDVITVVLGELVIEPEP